MQKRYSKKNYLLLIVVLFCCLLPSYAIAEILLDYWIEYGDFSKAHWTGEQIPIKVVGRYGYYTKPTIWDNQNRVIGGWVKVVRKKSIVHLPYTIFVEEVDSKGKVIRVVERRFIKVSTDTPHLFTFKKQGIYRFKVQLNKQQKGYAPLSARYTPLFEVHEKRYNRSRCIYSIDIQMPAGFLGNGISINGTRTGCGKFTFYARARKGIIDGENRWSLVIKKGGRPFYYSKAHWVLKTIYREGKR